MASQQPPPPTSLPPLSDNAHGRELLISMWIEFAIITLILIARLFTRARLVRKVGWDDYIMVASYFVNLGAFILNNLAVNNGFGLHVVQIPPPLVSQAIKWAFLGQILGIMASAITRMAFIITLIYLLSPHQKIQLWMLRGFFALQICINSMTSLYILLQCKPTNGLWDPTIGADCLPPVIQEHIGFSQGASNSFTDLALAIFPATIIWKLNLKRSIKISLCVTMGLGVFAFATAIIKTVSLTEISADPSDLTFIMFGLQFWFCIENSALIVSATIPTLRPLLNRLRRHEATSHGKSDPDTRYNGTWNEIEGSAGANSMDGDSDKIELAETLRGGFGSTTETECVAVTTDGNPRTTQAPPIRPPGGIMKTVGSYVTH